MRHIAPWSAQLLKVDRQGQPYYTRGEPSAQPHPKVDRQGQPYYTRGEPSAQLLKVDRQGQPYYTRGEAPHRTRG